LNARVSVQLAADTIRGMQRQKIHHMAATLEAQVGQWSFAVNGPTTWNSLPPALRAPELSQNTFTCALKTHLFSTARHSWDVKLRDSGAEYKCTDLITNVLTYTKVCTQLGQGCYHITATVCNVLI